MVNADTQFDRGQSMKLLASISAAALAFASSSAFASALINEFEPNPSGSDSANQLFEFLGNPGDSFMGWVLSIEADAVSSQGRIDRASMVAGTFDANGLLLVSIPDLENPSNTVLLVDTFSGVIGDSIDVNQDGTVDATFWGSILDAVGIVDNSSDVSYASQLGGTDLAFIGDEPRLVFRDSVTLDWFAVDDRAGPDVIFDALGNVVTSAFASSAMSDTFGSINPTATAAPVPVPAAALLFAPVAALLRRRAK